MISFTDKFKKKKTTFSRSTNKHQKKKPGKCFFSSFDCCFLELKKKHLYYFIDNYRYIYENPQNQKTKQIKKR